MQHKLTAVFAFAVLLPLTSLADQCQPVENFIALGEKAKKCVQRINQGQSKANDVLSTYGLCTNVRSTRNDVEKKVSELPVATVNTCAGKNLQAYTDAATSIHRLYQIELRLQ